MSYPVSAANQRWLARRRRQMETTTPQEELPPGAPPVSTESPRLPATSPLGPYETTYELRGGYTEERVILQR